MKRVLVTGASGYIGSRLVQELLAKGYTVRAAARDLKRLDARPWAAHPKLEKVAMDALWPASVNAAVKDCRIVYYLIHSMEAGVKDFAATELEAARNVRDEAYKEGAQRIIYLGGLGHEPGEGTADLSEHLRSRNAVAAELRKGLVPITALKSPMIIGRGSASFEILRGIVESVKIIMLPPWADTKTQPIAIRNALAYLVGCIDARDARGATLEIGGPDVITYKDLMMLYADEAGLERSYVPVPDAGASLGAFMVKLVSDVPRELIHPLIEGLRNETIVHDPRMLSIVKQRLLPTKEALRAALDARPPTDAAGPWPAETRWPGDAEWTR